MCVLLTTINYKIYASNVLGPWDGYGGNKWDDGAHSAIRTLLIVYGSCIDSIQIEYVDEGTSMWSKKHGGNAGSKTEVKLDYPDEYITEVNGWYGKLDERESPVVRSLAFKSNKRTYGPFGANRDGKYFSSSNGANEGKYKIVGFHGRSGWYLDSIGFYLEPINQLKRPKIIGGQLIKPQEVS